MRATLVLLAGWFAVAQAAAGSKTREHPPRAARVGRDPLSSIVAPDHVPALTPWSA